jgi:hypothetical protein
MSNTFVMCHSKKLYLLDDEWSDFIDKESGLGGMFVINNMVIVASNFVLAAYNNKGKNL